MANRPKANVDPEQMIPILEETPEGQKGYTFAEFEARFLDICGEHQSANRAAAFAFLLFDASTPELPKLLRDAEYWRALDGISGHHLSVFTLLTRQPTQAIGVEERHLVGAGPVTDPGKKVQLILQSYFCIEESLRLPGLLFFQLARGKISNSFMVQLRSQGVEPTFNELRELLSSAAAAVAQYEPAVAFDPEIVFKAVKATLIKRKLKHDLLNARKVFDTVKDVAALAGLLT